MSSAAGTERDRRRALRESDDRVPGYSHRVTERWAYLGPEGTFTEQAAITLSGDASGRAYLIPLESVTAAVTALRMKDVDAAVVPLENSVEGGVTLTQDELIHGDEVRIFAETYVAVRFDLLVRPGTPAADIHTIGSHPHGHAQVREYLGLRFPAADAVVTSSTAAAAAAVRAGELDAAVAAPVAADHYGLQAVVRNIGLDSDALTRFVQLRRPAPPAPPTGNDRTSLVISVPNRPGTLLGVLEEIARRGINLTRLESRPTRETMGDYLFGIDADGHLAEPAMADTVAALHRRGALHRFLGSYPRGQGAAVARPDYAAAEAYIAAEEYLGRLREENR